MKFRILGPLEVDADGGDVTPNGAKARALLTFLILRANEPVDVEQLVDELWRTDPPINAAKTVQIQVSRLRKSLGDSRLGTVGSAYALRVDAGELDAENAERLIAAGRKLLEAGQAEAAVGSFDDALALFRGPPLTDVRFEDFAQSAIVRLDELKLEAAEGRIAAGLASGEDGLIGRLEGLVAAHPLRERFLEQLMLALYRAGRQAEALAVYRNAVGTLRDELGLEPGPALRALERQILNQDPALDARVALPRTTRRRRRIRIGAAVTGAVAIAGAAALGVAPDWGSDRKNATLPTRSLARLDPITLERTGIVRIAGAPGDVVIGRRAVFVAVPGSGTVVVVDARTLATTVLGAPVRPSRLAVGHGGLWVADAGGRRLALLGSTRVLELPGDRGPPLDAIVDGVTALWVAERDISEVLSLDTRSGRVRVVENGGRDSFFDGRARRAAAVAAGSLWVSNPVTVYPATDRLGRVSRIDLASGRVLARIRLPSPPVAIAADDAGVWIALERGEGVWRVDPRDDVAVAAVRVGSGIVDLAVDEDAVWVLDREGTVSRVDAHSNVVTASVELGRGSSVAVGHGAVWIAAG